MDPAITTAVSSVADSLKMAALSQIEGAASGFLKDHPDIPVAIGSMALTMGEALVMSHLTSDPATKQQYVDAVDAEKDAIKEKAEAVLVDIDKATGSLIVQILDGIWKAAGILIPIALQVGAKAATGGIL